MVTIYDTCGEVLKVYEDLDTLVGADLSYEDLEFADFRGVDVSGADFHNAELYGAEFDDWVFDDANHFAPDFADTCYEIRLVGGSIGCLHKEFRG